MCSVHKPQWSVPWLRMIQPYTQYEHIGIPLHTAGYPVDTSHVGAGAGVKARVGMKQLTS